MLSIHINTRFTTRHNNAVRIDGSQKAKIISNKI